MKSYRLFRFTCFILTFLMVLSVAACADNSTDNTPQDTTTAAIDNNAADTAASTTAAEQTTYEENNVDPSLNFGGETVSFLYWNDGQYEECYSDGETGEVVNDAIYRRNTAVEDSLGIRFEFIGEKGNEYNEAPFALKVNNSIAAGDHAYDLICAYSYTAGLCTSQGLYYDLSDVEHLDFEKPWWPDMLINQSTINNKIYFVSGDISANAIYMMYVTFFNKTIHENFKLEDPYKLVEEGKWTIDKQFEMCSGVYADLNGNGTKDTGDRCGLYIYTLHFDSFLWGSDIFIVDSLNDDVKFSADFLGEKTVSLQEKLKNWVYDTDNGLLVTQKDNNHQYFGNGFALFWNDRCHQAINYAATNVSYGILPIAKYDEAQESYVTIMGNPFSLYALPKDSQNTDMMGAVIECMASESYRTVSPALYEQSFKYKYSQDDVSAKMFDIAKGTVVFDLARIFSNSLDAYKSWQKAIVGSTAWTTTVKGSERVWNKQLEKIIAIFE